MEILINPALWGVVGSVITGVIAYMTATSKGKIDYAVQRELYVDKRMQELLAAYKEELLSLKTEIKVLTDKNQELLEEVISLKAKIMELEGIK